MASQNRRHSRRSDGSKTLWDYLNSPFGIWFLSSILLASFTSFHGYLQSRRLKEEKMAALAWEMSRRYRDFLTNCETAKKESADWKCYSELNTAYWTLADYGERYRLLQFKGAGMHELVHEMKLLNNTKGVQLEDALDEILNTLKKYYPPDNFDRNTVVSQLETIANRVLVADLGATSTTSTASPTPTSATASK